MECKWKDCSNDAKGKSPYCSGTCKKRWQRASGTKQPVSGTDVPVEVGQKPSGTEQANPNTTCFAWVFDTKVYGRRAVSYFADSFATRPEPLSETDTPIDLNRGRYTRQDGSVYQFDCVGTSFEVTDGLCYATGQDVMDAHARRTSSVNSQTQAEAT